jgi:hypothetical protein
MQHQALTLHVLIIVGRVVDSRRFRLLYYRLSDGHIFSEEYHGEG